MEELGEMGLDRIRNGWGNTQMGRRFGAGAMAGVVMDIRCES